MPQSFSDYDSQYLSSNQRRGLSFLPTSKMFKSSKQQQSHMSASRPSPLHHEIAHSSDSQSPRHRESSSSNATTSAPTSRSSTTSSLASHPANGNLTVKEAMLRAQEIHPTSDVAQWAHQMHLTQGRSYWWCQGCFPPEVAEPLTIPKAMTGRRVRINEPSHCYDI